jgi:hypothetical protein
MSLTSIRAKLDAARSDAAAAKTFGASSHRFELHPAVPADEVAAFEERLGVGLPADYRAFLIEVGNGGAGPHHGIFPMGTWDAGGHGVVDFRKSKESLGDPSKPFPYEEAWNWSEARLEELQEDDSGDLELEYLSVVVDGAIPICHEGCALRDWLVLTGKEAGHVWHDATADFGGWWPWQDATGAHLTFTRWYEDWLDAALAGKKFLPRSPAAWDERRRIDGILGR